jgi:hypothetical protein
MFYVYRFSRISDLAIEANFSSVDGRSATVPVGAQRFYTASANYRHNLTERLQFLAGARYELRDGGSSPKRSGGSFRLGVAFALGQRGKPT